MKFIINGEIHDLDGLINHLECIREQQKDMADCLTDELLDKYDNYTYEELLIEAEAINDIISIERIVCN